MAIIKCKMCGGDLELIPDSTVCECEYCGTRQTVPSADSEKMLSLFHRAGKLLRACEFDKAYGIYESIINEFPDEAEAYWGLVLCKFGIEYVDDPASGKKVPTCHRSSFESIFEDENFEQACENADAIARRVYREEAKAIEELRKGIIEVSSKEEPYDIFISYKELTDDGDRTLDSVIAQDIYTELTNKSGTGGIYEINDHLFEGRYTPTNARGKREVHTVYSKTKEECEAMLEQMITEVRAKIKAEKQQMKQKASALSASL